MAQSGYTTIQTYHSSTAGAVPSAVNLADGEIAVNVSDLKLYVKHSSGAVAQVGGGATGGGTNGFIYENDITVTTNYTITTGKNAMSAGPITVNSGVVVTVPSGSTYTIV